MTSFEVPTLTTHRVRLRAFRAGDLDAFAAMRANPEVIASDALVLKMILSRDF
jgi:hypothetical protein